MKIAAVLKMSILALAFSACDAGPKVIESTSTTATPDGSAVVEGVPTVQTGGESGMHKVVVKEILDTEKYTYMAVSEDGSEFWVAVTKRPIEVGATYYFQGGLLKKNFYSREYDRTFETLYLVSDIRQQPVGSGGGSAVDQALGGNAIPVDAPINVKPAEGATKLSELFANKKKYDGKMVKVSGKVVKINPMIMGRNWLHVQDGSGKEFDLTVTTMENIPLGHVVTLEGTIALDKDFGAGYRYDIIMEGAVLK